MAKQKVVLTKDHDSLGSTGEVVLVSGGYARNFLLPRGFALAATKANVTRAEALKASAALSRERDVSGANVAKAKVEATSFTFKVQAGPDGRLFGSVTAADVAKVIGERLGVEVDRHDVSIDEPIRHLGTHTVWVKLHKEVAAGATLEVEATT